MLTWFRRRTPQAVPSWERDPTRPRLASVTRVGRRHLTGVPYALPKDLSEVNRLDFQHYLYRHVLKGNFLAPIYAPRAILDVAAGTGIWGMELARQFPRTRIIGFDLEKMKENEAFPANYSFVQGNLLDGLPFQDNLFDFVHQRLVLASAIPLNRWRDVLRELLRVTRPGGYVELPEVGVGVDPIGPLTRRFLDWGIEAGKARGLDPREIPHLERFLAEAGGVHIGHRTHALPLGSWGGRIGGLMETNLIAAFAALQALYLEQGTSAQEFQALLGALPEEWERYRSTMQFFVFWCQK